MELIIGHRHAAVTEGSTRDVLMVHEQRYGFYELSEPQYCQCSSVLVQWWLPVRYDEIIWHVRMFRLCRPWC